MKIWINAFIPKVVAGYTVPILRGENAGKTAVPLPWIARLNPANALKPLSAGYLTDLRDFSTDRTASSRMHSFAEITLGPTGWSFLRTEHNTSGTTEVDMETGSTLNWGPADMSRCNFYGLDGVAPVQSVPFSQFLYVKCAASDPLVATAADIDYEAVFKITTTLSPPPFPNVHVVEWRLLIDQFPAFEAYIERNGIIQPVLTSFPVAGKTVSDLPGPATNAYSGTLVFSG